ncbi:MAG TPA: right-handed parallel beta-helix repeat-containing protein [Thermoanaerobaculia bacterium]
MVLDSGGYGAVTINQAVSLEAPDGIYAGITASSGDAITVAAGVNDVVVLRGLTLTGTSAAGNGINVVTAATVHVEHCTIRGFSAGNGILATESVLLQQLYVEDSEIEECNKAVNATASTLSFVWIDRCRFEGGEGEGTGLLLEGPSDGSSLTVSISESRFTGWHDGIEVGDTVFLTVDRCVLRDFSIDISALGTRESTLTITNSVVPNSFAGVELGGHVSACSLGNNFIAHVIGTLNQCPLQ